MPFLSSLLISSPGWLASIVNGFGLVEVPRPYRFTPLELERMNHCAKALEWGDVMSLPLVAGTATSFSSDPGPHDAYSILFQKMIRPSNGALAFKSASRRVYLLPISRGLLSHTSPVGERGRCRSRVCSGVVKHVTDARWYQDGATFHASHFTRVNRYPWGS